MIDLAKKNLTIAITLGIGGLTLAYAFLVFLPAQRQISEQRHMLAEKQKAVVQSTRTKLAVAETTEKIELAQTFVEQWQAAAPAESGASELFGTLAQFASEAGVEIMQFQPHPPESLETIGRLRIALAVQGQFAEIHDLFRRLETLEGTVWVENLEIEVNQAAQGEATCEATLVVFTDRSENSD